LPVRIHDRVQFLFDSLALTNGQRWDYISRFAIAAISPSSVRRRNSRYRELRRTDHPIRSVRHRNSRSGWPQRIAGTYHRSPNQLNAWVVFTWQQQFRAKRSWVLPQRPARPRTGTPLR
jgi:hypothetical protein